MELNKIFAQHKENNASDKKIIKRNRRPKNELFYEEREQVINKINHILGINNDNNILYLYDLQKDNDKKEKILALSDDVKKYFKAGDWAFFKKEESKDNYVLLFKSVYKDMGWQLFSSNTTITRDNQKIRTTKYGIVKK